MLSFYFSEFEMMVKVLNYLEEINFEKFFPNNIEVLLNFYNIFIIY